MRAGKMLFVGMIGVVFALSCAHKPAIKLQFEPPDVFDTGGPGFFCYRDGAVSGKPTNTLVCVDFAGFVIHLKEHPEELLREPGEKMPDHKM